MHASACRFFVVFGDNLFLCCNPPSFLFGTFAFCRHFIQYLSKKLARLKTDNFLCSNFYFSFCAKSARKPLGRNCPFFDFWQTFYKRSFFLRPQYGACFFSNVWMVFVLRLRNDRGQIHLPFCAGFSFCKFDDGDDFAARSFLHKTGTRNFWRSLCNRIKKIDF